MKYGGRGEGDKVRIEGKGGIGGDGVYIGVFWVL